MHYVQDTTWISCNVRQHIFGHLVFFMKLRTMSDLFWYSNHLIIATELYVVYCFAYVFPQICWNGTLALLKLQYTDKISLKKKKWKIFKRNSRKTYLNCANGQKQRHITKISCEWLFSREIHVKKDILPVFMQNIQKIITDKMWNVKWTQISLQCLFNPVTSLLGV